MQTTRIRRCYLDDVVTFSLQEAIAIHLGLSSSILEMLPSFEARNLRRASRSHAQTGLCWGLKNGDFAWEVCKKWEVGDVSSTS